LPRDNQAYLEDIKLSIAEIKQFLSNTKSIHEFENNTEKIRATDRNIEIIGEAVKNIPANLKDLEPIIPWQHSVILLSLPIVLSLKTRPGEDHVNPFALTGNIYLKLNRYLPNIPWRSYGLI